MMDDALKKFAEEHIRLTIAESKAKAEAMDKIFKRPDDGGDKNLRSIVINLPKR